MNIPFSKPTIGREEFGKIKEVINSGWLGMGETVFEFERALKEYIGVKYVIAVNTGTSALHIALDSFGINTNDEIVVPSLTFVATPHAVLMCGAKVIFCDVEEETLNMDIKDVRDKITRNTKAIIPVHYSGLPCNMDSILKLSRQKGLFVIEDAAHAFGSIYKGKKIGSFGDASCFSFDPIKVITCGEGGAVATNNDKVAKIIMRKRIMGIDKDTWNRTKTARPWVYKVTDLGYRYHMSNINAAIGLMQLKKINGFINYRRQMAARYDEGLKNIDAVTLIKKDYSRISPFNYIIKIRDNRREALMGFLKQRGIQTGVHYIPNHLQPFFKKFKTRLPVTEKIYRQILTLPFHCNMKNSDIDLIINSIKDFFKNNGKKI